MDINTIDQNNMKALTIAKGLLHAAIVGYRDIDCISALGIICDYLQSNDEIFNANA